MSLNCCDLSISITKGSQPTVVKGKQVEDVDEYLLMTVMEMQLGREDGQTWLSKATDGEWHADAAPTARPAAFQRQRSESRASHKKKTFLEKRAWGRLMDANCTSKLSYGHLSTWCSVRRFLVATKTEITKIFIARPWGISSHRNACMMNEAIQIK